MHGNEQPKARAGLSWVAHAGKFSAFLEERINVGVNFLLSAEIDHVKKDYKFGFGLTVGE